MKKKCEEGGIELGKLIVYAAELAKADKMLGMSYFEYEIEESDTQVTITLIPFYIGAIESLSNLAPLVWVHLWDGTEVRDENAVGTIVDSFCKYFGIPKSLFAHFLAPMSQNGELTNKCLMHNATSQDIASIIFDFVILYKVTEFNKLDISDYIKLN